MSFVPFIGIGVVVAIWLVWMLFFKNKMTAKYSGAYTEAQGKFNENKDAIVSGYLTDQQKFGLLTKAIGDQENILGIASYAEPKSVGKSLTEGLKTTITNVKKVNMDLFYLVITDKNLHSIETNGENTVNHLVWDLGQIKNAQASKTSGLNIKNAVTGVSGDLNTFKFEYKDEKYSYNLFKMIFGYPFYTVQKDTMSGEFYRIFPGKCDAMVRNKLSDPEAQLEYMVNTYFYDGFRNAVAEKLQANIP